MTPLWNSPRDWFRWYLFEIGAGYSTEKLAADPEGELRVEVANWLSPPSDARVLDVVCGPGHLARRFARRMGGLVWFARGRKPASRWCHLKSCYPCDSERSAGFLCPAAKVEAFREPANR